MMVLAVLVGAVALAVLFVIGIYNSLIALRNQVKNAWAQIDVQLKRRYDLIPNLIETVKGYKQYEQQTLEKIVQARSQAMNSHGMAEKAKAEGELTQVLTRFFALSENYPDLKANQNFLSLQEEISTTENKISFARQNYNDQVLFYNNKIQMFPSNLIAQNFGFKQEESFAVQEAEKVVPKVSF